MHKRFLLLVLACLPFSLPARAADNPYLQALIAHARTLHLADAPEWHALLHYRPNLLLPGVTGDADDPNFYNAPDGKTNPESELEATLAAFFSNIKETDTVQNPQCRFIARYQWLKQELHFDPTQLPEHTCARYHAWRAALNPTSLTLVFPSAYINNPSSMFGHTLLRVDGADQTDQTRLLAYAINYAVNPHGDSGPAFIVKSLIGSYPGDFSIAPYYLKVKEYNDIEDRDMWEYQLNFTPAEIERLLEHAWELGPIKFDYYFFDDNCAYELLSLFDVARPSLHLTDQFHGYVIPTDTLRAVAAQRGMVRRVTFRPANGTILRYRLNRMTEHERVLVEGLADGDLQANLVETQALPAAEQAELIETAYDYVRYEYAAGHRLQAESAQRSHDLLLARSRVPYDRPVAAVPTPAVSPDKGHKTTRVAVGFGTKDGRAFQELEWRPAYHDVLDADGGYTFGAQINFLNVALRHYARDDRAVIDRAALVDIVSLSPRDRFFKPISWKFNTGYAREQLAKNDTVGVFRSNGGAGFGVAPWNGAIAYVFAETTLDVSGGLQRRYALGVGPSVGLLAQVTPRWKVHLFARALDYGLGDVHRAREVSFEQNVALNAQNALRLRLSRREERGYAWNTALLSWHLFF